jgi:hypothetical protein
MKYILIIMLFIVITSCLPEQAVRELDTVDGNTTSSNTDSNDDSSNETTETVFTNTVGWLNSGLVNTTLTVDVDNGKTVYLVGDQIHNYLSTDFDGDGVKENFEATFCLEMNFTQSGTDKPSRLRVKAVPAYSNNFSSNNTVRFLRVNLNTSSGNEYCQKSSNEVVNGISKLITYKDSNYDSIENGSDTSVVLSTDTVCPSCSNILATQTITLYQENTSNTLDRVDTSKVSYDDLVFRIDMNSNADNGSSSCTDNECVAQGFNCCVQGQCINEKNIKVSGVQADVDGFAIAEQEKYTNPSWFKKYPQFYYICLEQQPGDDDDDDSDETTDPVGDADARLAQLVADYECIEELQAKSETTPFHTNPISSATYTKCEKTTTTDTNYYKTVMKRLYSNCGCSESTDLDLMVTNCPKYTYKPTYLIDNSGNETSTITSISCISPPASQTPLPFQDLELALSSKSAPHRFFDSTGSEITNVSELPSGATGTQEGVAFTYLDDYKLFPNNGEFNMNSIIGQITTALDQAHPAKMIELEFDKQYIISAQSGLASLCPTCAKDSWFNNFSAAPFATQGVGLQPVGFTTQRDTYSTNTTLGNYEDTIFGRACWIPPTMIPFGHVSNTDEQTQRLNRLKTQSSLFINGYQRDWFGFNKGALIGSFDGVTWFAIGKGRIVKSTSDRLYLAINAPFADLTSPTDHVVSVQEYDFVATAPIYDYSPELEINDAYQNEAATCQKHHECEVDSHCITKLGWEYVCADVTYNKTNWPTFTPEDAVENANTSTPGTIYEFLQQKRLPPGGTTKRCVYRGAGSPCRIDYDNITDEGLRKNLACAPNFYCAKLDSNGAFNKEVSRFARPLDELIGSKNHIYGQDADILGRPKDYITTSSIAVLPSEVQSALTENILLTDSAATGNIGLCRPGKLLPDYSGATTTQNWEQSNQHQEADDEHRTDFISQISSCNSALYTDMRYSSCPMLDEEGNYIHLQDTFLNDIFTIADSASTASKDFVTERYSFAQNSCGLESLSSSVSVGMGITANDLKNYSAFKTIEADSLFTSAVQIEPTLVRDACLRKAGAVCHTDLDCSPNKKMASVIDLVAPSFFGNDAEKSYYEEYLVCGQAESQPSVSDDNFNTYSMHNNRCCRPIGESISMFTEDSPNSVESNGLETHVFGGINPNKDTRYSRYSVVESQIDATSLESFIIRPTANTDDVNADKTLDNPVNITNPNQWNTIHEAASKTCCGGSWVRKFDDGTNDWSRKRLGLDPSNFSCLNYRSPLYLTDEASSYGLTPGQLSAGKNLLCLDSSNQDGGCAQTQMGPIDSESIIKPTLNLITTKMEIHSDFALMQPLWGSNLWAFNELRSLDSVSIGSENPLVLDWEEVPEDSDNDGPKRMNFMTELPIFISTSETPGSPFDIDGDGNSDIEIFIGDPMNNGDYYSSACIEQVPVGNNYSCGSGGRDGVCQPKDPWTAGSCANQTGTCSNGAFTTYDSCMNNSSSNTFTFNTAACCYMYDESNRSLTVAHNQAIKDSDTSLDKNSISMKIVYTAPGTLAWEQLKISAATPTTNQLSTVIPHRRSAEPGNAMYYLKKLARLEYLGIPQMTYEPVYCNDNYQNLVPGIFKESLDGDPIKTVNDFINHPRSFFDGNVDTPWNSDSAPGVYDADGINQNLVGTQEMIDHSPIFSDNQFKCCTELLGKTTDPTNCCSGFAVDSSGDSSSGSNETTFTCKLPKGTNLNVFLNKYVSGEGLSSALGVTPLTTDDFDSSTGEPLTNKIVITKLNKIGEVVCADGVTRRGGVFGKFQAEPYGVAQVEIDESLRPFSIVDSFFDAAQSTDSNVGRTQFNQGYIWNHHVYCE